MGNCKPRSGRIFQHADTGAQAGHAPGGFGINQGQAEGAAAQLAGDEFGVALDLGEPFGLVVVVDGVVLQRLTSSIYRRALLPKKAAIGRHIY
jgi:hypothetical protein